MDKEYRSRNPCSELIQPWATARPTVDAPEKKANEKKANHTRIAGKSLLCYQNCRLLNKEVCESFGVPIIRSPRITEVRCTVDSFGITESPGLTGGRSAI
jgi:hypothetical protein